MDTERRHDCIYFTATLLVALLLYLLLAHQLGYGIWEHSPYDSYTLQALAWRNGSLWLDQNYTWLELAVYNGHYFVSFPPFPTVIMLVLSIFFGAETPSMAVNLCLFLGSAALGYKLLRRFDYTPLLCAVTALFLVCGCNLLEVSLNGGVWNIAQGASFFFTTACIYAMETPVERRSPLPMVLGPLCLAFAVGCRPFQAIYVPYVLFRLYQWCAPSPDMPRIRVLRKMIPYLVAPALVAVAYGALNYARFGNIFEFGHNYLPEFSSEGGIQFSLAHWPQNLKNILRLPYIENHMLLFPVFSGFAFYLCNPLFVISAIDTIRRGIKRQIDAQDVLLLLSIFLHFNFLLLHRTFGGYQFGTRYLVDLLPMVFLLTFRRRKSFTVIDGLLMAWGIGFNIYGTLVLHLVLS